MKISVNICKEGVSRTFSGAMHTLAHPPDQKVWPCPVITPGTILNICTKFCQVSLSADLAQFWVHHVKGICCRHPLIKMSGSAQLLLLAPYSTFAQSFIGFPCQLIYLNFEPLKICPPLTPIHQ